MADLKTEELVAKIKEFAKIADELDERYREKCFEVLLADYLGGVKGQVKVAEKIERSELAVKAAAPPKFVVPIDARAFLEQYNIPEETVQKLFVIEGDEIRTKYHIKTTVKSDAQIQLALLTAFENALRPGGKFEFSMEDVRQRCKDRAVYDTPNFKAHFNNNAKFFKSLKKGDEEHIELSPEGKAELADVILAISG